MLDNSYNCVVPSHQQTLPKLKIKQTLQTWLFCLTYIHRYIRFIRPAVRDCWPIYSCPDCVTKCAYERTTEKNKIKPKKCAIAPSLAAEVKKRRKNWPTPHRGKNSNDSLVNFDCKITQNTCTDHPRATSIPEIAQNKNARKKDLRGRESDERFRLMRLRVGKSVRRCSKTLRGHKRLVCLDSARWALIERHRAALLLPLQPLWAC